MVINGNYNSNKPMYCWMNNKQLIKLYTPNVKYWCNVISYNNAHSSKTEKTSFTNIYISVSFKVFSVYNEWGYYSTIPTQTTLIFKPWIWPRCLPFPQCVSPFHSLAEMIRGSKIHGHMTVKVYSCQDAGGGSTYPTLPYFHWRWDRSRLREWGRAHSYQNIYNKVWNYYRVCYRLF